MHYVHSCVGCELHAIYPLGSVAAKLNLTWWALGAFAVALVVVQVVDRHKHEVRQPRSLA